jgi:hypothetical protein
VDRERRQAHALRWLDPPPPFEAARGQQGNLDDIRWMSRLLRPEVASLSRMTGRDLRRWTA